MSEEAQRPLAGLLTEAREGRLTVNFGGDSPNAMSVNAEEFVYIERDCESFKLLIQEIQRMAREIAQREKWDLGEANPDFVSARTVVARFRSKAEGAEDGNSLYEIMDQHYQIVSDIQEMHRLIAQRYMETDSEFASRYNELMSAAPPSVPLVTSTLPTNSHSGW